MTATEPVAVLGRGANRHQALLELLDREYDVAPDAPLPVDHKLLIEPRRDREVEGRPEAVGLRAVAPGLTGDRQERSHGKTHVRTGGSAHRGTERALVLTLDSLATNALLRKSATAELLDHLVAESE
jgi:hypothetical protein